MKRFLTALLCGLLIAAAALGGLALVLDHFGVGDVTGITKKVRNPDNLIDVSAYTFKSGAVFEGVTVTYDEDGVMTLNGQATADVDVCLGLFYVIEDAYYTVSVYCPEPARTTTGTKVVYTSDNWGTQKDLAAGSFADDYTFNNTKLQYVKFYLTIKAGDAFENYTAAPVMVEGKAIGQFYINETIQF
ncbi:MAG: hypothetical protein IJC29_03795 [Clostridia bacterium]|nr:hypothetical protein [Clostridia bacterium]